MTDVPGADFFRHTLRWKVRTYELDENGHVNNAVYLQWAEQMASEHAEAVGFGRQWCLERGGIWVVRRHEITYHQPARRNDELELTVRVRGLGGVRGQRHTDIRSSPNGTLLAEVASEWVWVRIADGRPARVPAELLAAYSHRPTGHAGSPAD